MAHHINWDNIHLHIHDNDVRYKRRLRRKQLYISCSPSSTDACPVDGSRLKKFETVKDEKSMGNDDELVVACPNVVSDLKPIRVNFDGKRNDVYPDMEMFKEGFREGGQSLVCKVDDNVSDDVSLKKLENQNFLCYDDFWVECLNVVGNSEPIGVKFSTRGNFVDLDVQMFKEDLKVKCDTRENVVDPDLKMCKEDLKVKCGTRGNDVDPDFKMFKEGFREGGQSLVCKVDDNVSDDFSLKKLENVQDRNFLCYDDFWVECLNVVGNSEPIGVKCGTRGNVIDPDVKMFKEDLKVNCDTREHVVDTDLKMCKEDLKVKCGTSGNDVDPDFKMFKENLKEDGHSFVLEVKNDDGSLEFLKYEKDVLRKEYRRKMKGDNVKNVQGKQKGDTAKILANNIKKRKRDKVVPSGDVNFVSIKEKRSVMVRREGFSRNSNRFTVAKRSSVVKRGDDIEISFIGKPNEIEEDTVSKSYRPSKIIKNKRPSKMDDGRNIEYLSKSKKRYEKLDRRPCLTRTDHVSNPMDIAGKAKIHLAVLGRESAEYRRTTTGNKQRDLVVQQGEDIKNSRFSSGIGNMDVMVKEEKFDDSTNVVLVKKSMQMIQGRDGVYDDNLRPWFKCDKKFGMYAEVKEENTTSLNYEEDNGHSPDFVSTKEKWNVMVSREGFSRNSNRFTVAKRSSVVKRGDDIEIIFIGKPNEIEEVTVSKSDRPCNIIKNKRPSKMDDGRNIEYLSKSKKRYEKLDKRPCLTRTDHVSNPMDIAGKVKRHLAVLGRESAEYRRTTTGNKQRDLVVQQGGDIENSRFSSGIGNMDVMVKEEKFDDSMNVVLVKKSMQMIQGRDGVYDDNLRPWFKCDKKFGMYAEVKEENTTSLNYEEDNGHSPDFVSTKEKRNVMVSREGFYRNSNRFTFAKRSSVVKRGDDIEIIFIGKPNEIEEVTVSKSDMPSKIIKNKRPSKMDDGRGIEYRSKSKKRYEKLNRRPCLTRTDHVSNPMDIAGKEKRHLSVLARESAEYRRTTTGNKQRDLVVQQGEDIENSRFSSGIGNMDVMVEEKFDDSTNVVLVKKSMQMIQGRDGVYDDNLRPQFKCDKKFGMYAEVKVENTTSLNYEENNGHSPDLEILMKSKKKHEKLERRPCLTRTNHLSNPINIAGKAKRHLTGLSSQSAKYQRTSPRNEWRDLVVQQGEDIENSRFSSGTGNMDVMVKKEKFDDSMNVVLVRKSMQMIHGRDSVYDDNLQPQYKCDKKFGKYAEVKEENAKSLNYDEEDNEDSSDVEILETDNQQNLSKFEVMKVFNASVIEDNPLSMKIPSDCENSAFREELMDILRRPYNLEEYRSLMQKAKYRHLNWGPEYSDGLKEKEVPNAYGKSPLDYHPDVQRRLRRCRRISKRLNILRGFIYWYGRTCQDGAFKPWLDKSCLAVTPSPR